MTEYVGIDGCPDGWIAVFINEYDVISVKVEEKLTDFDFNKNNPDNIVLIDMPIGLKNRPDKELRDEMHGNKNSVFSLPENLPDTEKEYREKRDGITISAQTDAIMHKIYEVTEFAAGNDPDVFRFWESHPEFCFELLKNRERLFPKKTGAGQAERLLILKEYLGSAGIEKLLQEARKRGEDAFKFDDLLDAACLAVMAKIIGTKENPGKIKKEGVAAYPFIAYAKNLM